LEASAAIIRALLGIEDCHRDTGVARYGLKNVLFPIGPDRFLEVVCPTGPGTAAGRFLEQTQGRGGYMLIFDCDDPKARAERAGGLGVRLANHIDRELYQGYQLHPKDCRATFLEFNHTLGGEDARGAYWPAGEHWRQHVRTEVTHRLEGVEVVSHDPAGLAAHWSAIMNVPATAQSGRHVMKVDQQTITILGAPGAAPWGYRRASFAGRAFIASRNHRGQSRRYDRIAQFILCRPDMSRVRIRPLQAIA
jgi:hypothetical protein